MGIGRIDVSTKEADDHRHCQNRERVHDSLVVRPAAEIPLPVRWLFDHTRRDLASALSREIRLLNVVSVALTSVSPDFAG